MSKSNKPGKLKSSPRPARPSAAVDDGIFEVNGFKVTTNVVGTVTEAHGDGASIQFAGFLDGAKKATFGLTRVVLVDGARRLLGSSPIFGNGWRLSVPATSIPKDEGARTVSLYVVGSTERQFYQLLDKAELKEAWTSFAKELLPADVAALPTFKAELQELIARTVATPYISTSTHNGITTGNSYQTLFLDGKKTQGREDREKYLRMVDLANKSLMDIGCNMGEMSRLARYLGADAVDGFEYDPSFVEIGRAVNALNGITGVSLYQADVTQPDFFKNRRYDAVLALNVWVYIERQFAHFPDMAPLVLFETHTLDHGLKFYYDRLLPHYPHATCLSLSDFGDDPTRTRAFIALATSSEELDGFVRQEKLKVQPYFANRFLEKVGVLDARGIRQLAAHCYGEVGSEMPARREDFTFGADRYFVTLLAGYHQWQAEKSTLSSSNIYLDYLRRGIENGAIDQHLKSVATDERRFQRKVANKFEDLDLIVSGRPELIPPVLLYKSDEGGVTFETTAGETIQCRDIDGHHRYFACQLAGVNEIHFRFG